MSYLGRIYDEHAQALFGFVLNWTRSESETHDVLQDLFAKLAVDASALEQAEHPRAFLLSMARHRLIDRARHRERRRQREDLVFRQEDALFEKATDPDRATFRSELQTALDALPEEQRAVVYLKLWEVLTFQEIAASLSISPHTAASRYRLGLEKLRGQLRPLYEEILT